MKSNMYDRIEGVNGVPINMPDLRDWMPITKQLLAALRQLESTNSVTDKRAMLTKYMKVEEFRDLLSFALDPYKTYGIKRFPLSSNQQGSGTWFDIKYFLEASCRKDSRPADVLKWLGIICDSMSPDVRDLFKRVLLKDLRCGVGATLVNSVEPGFIPQFGVMLADTLDQANCARLSRFEKVYAQPKLNGDRCVVVCAPDTAPEVFSRNGHPLNNYGYIAKALQYFTVSDYKQGIVFDGEVILEDFFKTRGVKKLAGNEAVGAVFHCFDCVPFEQWKSGETETFSKRVSRLIKMAKSPWWEESTVLKRVPTMGLADRSWAALTQLRDKMIEIGHEGLIIRPDLPYNFGPGRTSLYKFKKMDTLDCVIKEVLPGEEGKKHAHHAGRLLVELPNGQTCKAGLRLDNAKRDKLWSLRGKYVGLVAEIAYQDKTVNQTGEWKLQFPVFTGRIRKELS